jgi:hypothetical protein
MHLFYKIRSFNPWSFFQSETAPDDAVEIQCSALRYCVFLLHVSYCEPTELTPLTHPTSLPSCLQLGKLFLDYQSGKRLYTTLI